MTESNRSFTVSKCTAKCDKAEGGRYKGKIPSQAARKAGRALLKSCKKRQLKFTLRETTQGSAHKEFTYSAIKVKLDKPQIIKRGNSTITVTHEYLVHAC
uniref:Uncharacterized protein n=1 Tax=viral metagenome TaxID=1070528 RepID=A0A6C0CR45_9ZZZZ